MPVMTASPGTGLNIWKKLGLVQGRVGKHLCSTSRSLRTSGKQVKLLLGTKVKLYRQARQEPRWFARWTVTCRYHSVSWTTFSISYVQMAVKLNGVRER